MLLPSSIFTKNEQLFATNQQQIAGVPINVKVSEQHSFEASVTKTAVEDGSQVAEHVTLNPAKVTVSFELTNSGDNLQKAQLAFERLRILLLERKPVELKTEHAIYTNMVLVNLSPLHQAPYKGALKCSATFEQINFVRLEKVQLYKRNSKVAKTAGSQVQGGEVPPKKYPKSGLAKIAGV